MHEHFRDFRENVNVRAMSYVNTLRTFVRVYELGSMSAAGRDQRVSAAVASARIAELEKHLGVRLFNRTTRSLQPTEQGAIFYKGALKILETVEEAEAAVADVSRSPRGSIHVAAPLGIGKRLIAPLIPSFKDLYPHVDVRLRLSDRRVDVTAEGLDVAFLLGALEDSNLRVRPIADCRRVLCAAPSYVEQRGMPHHGRDLIEARHSCLLLRFPGRAGVHLDAGHAGGPPAVRRDRAVRIRRRRRADGLGAVGARHHSQAGVRGRRAVWRAARW